MAETAYDCDVLIAGGGPTGITLAVLLAQRGVKVLVAEREANIYPLPRAAHVDHEVMRIFQEAGVADQIMATSRRASRYDFLNAKGKILLRFDDSDALGLGGWPMANMIHQPSLEAALRMRLSGLPSAELLCSTELTVYRDTGDGVSATVTSTLGSREVQARFLVGADGARSPVREASGIAFDDLGFEEPWLVVDAIVHDPARLPKVNLQICDPARPTTCVLMGEGRHRWEFMIKPGEDPAEVSSDASIAQMLKPWNVDGAVTLERKAVYTFRARIAKTWRKGNVLLAGDAAHQTPPFAGQGLCAGGRDAANLAWKLALAVRHGTSAELLDSYQLEREPHARATIGMAIMMGRTVCIASPRAAFRRDVKFRIARLLRLTPDGPPAYPPISAGNILAGSAGAGSYFPQLCDTARAENKLDDILGAGAWLLTRTHPDAEAPEITIVDCDAPRLAPFRADLLRWLDAHKADAVLVRPDRYVFGTGTPDVLLSHWSSLIGATTSRDKIPA